ncbi:uncharacterized protein LOC132564973 [Ylistrum balloti]|uniref:uncharacterized protein LOC132564973 n=1 Tax=Ylistrum balloti TaxID=509963 RepID=UPI002905C11B|nr:uncharacterized protein LOC132564973 [Ylistrum balloti]
MANMLIPSIVLLMSLAVVHCGNPTCDTNSCAPEKCKWTCKDESGKPVAEFIDDVCDAGDEKCGKDAAGECKSECESVPAPEVTTTVAPGNTADNGSVKLGLSTIVLVFGVLTRMFLQY